MGLSKYGLESWIKVCGRQLKHLVSSQQVQMEADRVWSGVEKCLFGNGNTIHFQKWYDLKSIDGKSNLNGAKFHVHTMTVEWTGLTLSCVIRKKRAPYIAASLNGNVAYCAIVRKMFDSGWRYYAVLCIRGKAVPNGCRSGKGALGIDPGVSTMAAIGTETGFLEELAPKVPEYNKQIRDLQYHMEASRRKTNPQKYLPDGAIDPKNRDRWVCSSRYKRNLQKLRVVYRKKAAYIKQDHEERANRFLEATDHIYIEKMDYRALQKRAKKTERQGHASAVRKKDGTETTVFKFKRKKRFGHSLNNRAPAMFLTILNRKAAMLDIPVEEIVTSSYKASQYDHVAGQCTKVPLPQKEKTIGGKLVQRDIYSAFLIQNPEPDRKHPDRRKCSERFPDFLKIQERILNTLKSSGQSMPQCFGF